MSCTLYKRVIVLIMPILSLVITHPVLPVMKNSYVIFSRTSEALVSDFLKHVEGIFLQYSLRSDIGTRLKSTTNHTIVCCPSTKCLQD